MIDGLPTAGDFAPSVSVSTRFGLALRAQANMGHWFEDDDVLVALHGYPLWLDPQQRAAAAREGRARIAARLYAAKGPELLQELHGAFSLCIIEKSGERALLAIDRFGVEPMCYAQVPNGPLVFGATTDSVRAYPGLTSTIAPQTIYNYLYFVDRVCAPATIYEEQKKLLPGECLLFDRGRLDVQAYWSMQYGADDTKTEEDLSAELLDHLKAALESSTSGEDVARTGAFLSGGLDSSTILSLLAERSPQSPKAFTIGFKEQGYDETGYAAIAAKHAHAEHDVYFLGPDHVIEAIPKLAQAYDEPFANSSVIPAYFCALRAKQAGIDVMLAGDGGDELFLGNSRYLDDRIFQYYRLIPRSLREALLEPMVRRLPLKDRIGLFRKADNYVRQARQSVPVRMTAANVYACLNYGEIFAADFLPQIDPSQPMRFVESIFFGTSAVSDLQRMMGLDLRITLADSDLRKVGKACELAGVRVRYPFMDDDLAAFAAKIPPQLLSKNGKLRYFYKTSVKRLLAPETTDKKKHGFGLPMFEYINKSRPLQDLFCDSLNSLKGRSIFQASRLDNLISHVHAGDSQIFHGVVWDLGVLELWLQSRAPGAFGGAADR